MNTNDIIEKCAEAKIIARHHAIERVSPKGERFIGTCRLCGTPNLTAGDVMKECPNQRGLTDGEALIESMLPKEPK